MPPLRLFAAALACALAAPACATPDAPNRLSVGVGLLAAPDYEGSNDYVLAPAAGAVGRFKGHNFSWRGTSLNVDLVPEHDNQKFKLIIAPFVAVNLDRSSKPHDMVLNLLRTRKAEVEVGATVGLAANGILTSKYDSLTVQISGSHDIGNVSKSFIITPTSSYVMPISKKAVLGLSLSADVVGGRYARYYFGIGPRSATRSGLPAYTPAGGLKSFSVGLSAARSLGHDIRRGFVIGTLITYERLVGDFAQSPIVATRGDASQFIVAGGVGYTF